MPHHSAIYPAERPITSTVDTIVKGGRNRLIGYKNGHVYDIDIEEAFSIQKSRSAISSPISAIFFTGIFFLFNNSNIKLHVLS